ncbi:MAG: PAS domain S-box protein [Candidatus Sulfotelmatobacter sp.]
METTPHFGGASVEPVLSLEKLAESEHRFRKLVEALPDAILVHSENKIVFVNPFCVRLHGAETAEQLLGRDISEFIKPEFLPAIQQRVEECYLTGTASSPIETILITCDGLPVDIEAVAIPISWNGAPAIEVVLRDIRQRKHAQHQAHEWQRRLELAQKAGLRIGLWDWDVVANTVIWSDETYRQFGLARDSFHGDVEDAVNRIHPDDRDMVEAAIGKVLRGDSEEYASQYRVLRPDGTTCWINAHGVMVRNGSKHMIGIGIDITDLKKSEQSLQESQEKYRLLLNSTAEAIYGLDLQGNCTFCNPACARLLGHRSTADLLGKNMHALMHHSRPDGTPYPEEECEIYVAVRQGRASHVTDEVLWRADRTSFPAEYWSYPMYQAGEIVGAVVTFLDISERKQAEQALHESEERHRHLFDNTTYGVFLSKPDGTLLDVNPAFVTMMGYGSIEELLACNLGSDIYENPAVRRSILDSYGESGRVDGSEANFRRKDGKIITVRINGGASRRDDGTVDHYEVIIEDITERRSLEQQFRQSQKMEAVGLLAGGISHDFNNLLGVILGNADLLLEKVPAGSQQRYAEAIKKAGSSAAQMIRQLLAFSRKQVLYPAVLDVNAVVSEIGKILHRLIGEDVRVTTDLETGLGPVRADRGQIEQILMNLATNARDAMPNGGTFIIRTANAKFGPEDAARYSYVIPGQYVHLSVSDTGVGMSEEVRTRIFEPFFTTKEKGRGTGLGLATVYGIVKQSGGFIWVSSTPGAGTTFDIYLPRIEGKAAPLIPNPLARTEYPRGTETILLLEDDDCLRELTGEILTGSGYNVIQAGRGDIAVDLATQFKGSIPLVVSDVVLPEISGPAAVKKLQLVHPEMKALYVSGYAEVPVAQQLIAEGATLLQKPVARMDLLNKVDEMLHRHDAPERRSLTQQQ